MDKVRMSNVNARKTAIALALVGMLLAGMGINSVNAAASPVTLESDISSSDVMVGTSIEATLTLTSSDTRYRVMEVYMVASWSSGVAWPVMFTNTDYDELPDGKVIMDKGSSATVKLLIECSGVCSAGDTNAVSIYGKSDPRFYAAGSSSSNCGSTDCETDTSAASSSANVTNTKIISLTARTAYASVIGIGNTCDAESSGGSNEVFQGETYLWGYSLENTGWNTDTYQFTSVVTSSSGYDVGYWSVTPGISDGKELTGQSDTSPTAVQTAAGSISITPAGNARPGVYNVELTVTSTNGAPDSGCDFDVVVPEPDLEVLDTDISFSHTGAWINTRGDSQRVTITAKIRNNGGAADSSGATTTDIEVKFYVDGSQLGSVQTIDSLSYGEEAIISVYWNPARAHDGDEVGIPIKVVVDPSDNIEETDQTNNEGSTTFKVVRTKASNPSFYMGFLSLTAAVGAAVLLSTYYRNKDLED